MIRVRRVLFSFALLLLMDIPINAQENHKLSLPDNLQVITPENVDQIEQLAAIGRGVVYEAAWSPDGKIIAVASSRGIWLFDAENLNLPPRLLEGHTGPVKVLAFHPNSRILASGSYDYIQVDSLIHLWDVNSGQLLNILEGHTDNISDLAFTSDGSYLISGGWNPDSSIRIWDFDELNITATTVIRIDIPYNRGIVDLAISQDSKFVAFSSFYNREWDGGAVYTFPMDNALGGNPIVTEVGSSYSPYGVSFQSNTNYLAYSLYGHVGIWNSEEGVTANENTFSEGRGTYGVTYSHSGSLLTFANTDRTIQLLNTKSGLIETIIKWSQIDFSPYGIPFNEAYSVSFSPDDSRIVSALPDNTVRIWDVQSGDEIVVIDIFTPSVSDFSLLEDNEVFAAGLTRDRQFRLWNQDGDVSTFIPADNYQPNEIFVLPSSDAIVYRTHNWENGSLSTILFDRASSFNRFLTGERWYDARIVAFSSDGNLLALNTREIYLDTTRGCFVIFNWRYSHLLKEFCGQEYFHFAIDETQSNFAVSAFWDNTISIWKIDNTQPTQLLKVDQTINSLQLNNNDTLLAAATGWRYGIEAIVEPGSINIFDFEAGEVLAKMSGHTDIIPALAFSPVNDLLASGSWDSTIRLWDVISGDELNLLDAHTDEISQIRFNKEGTILATGSMDGTIRLWGVVE